MISQPLSRQNHTVGGGEVFPETSSSSPSTAAADPAVELRHTPPGPRKSEKDSLTPFLSSSTSSPTADTEACDPAAQSNPVLSRPNAAWGPTRSPTVRPPPDTVLPDHPLYRHTRVLVSSANIIVPDQTASKGFQRSAAESTESAPMSDVVARQSSAPPLHAPVMNSLVRRYRTEEERLNQWRQGGGRVLSSAAFGHGDGHAWRDLEGAQEENQRSPTELCDIRHGVSRRPNRRGGEGRFRGGLVSAVQDAPLLRSVQAWWRSRNELRRMTNKTSRRLHPSTLHVSSAATAAPETQHHGGGAILPPPSEPAVSFVSSLLGVSRTGRAIFGRLSHSLPLSSERGVSIRLELLRSADAAQVGGGRRDEHRETAHGSVAEDQQGPTTEFAQMTAEAVSAGVVSPLSTVSRAKDDASLALPHTNALHEFPACGRGGASHWPQTGGEGPVDDKGDPRTPAVSSTYSSLDGHVGGGVAREAIQDTKDTGDLNRGQPSDGTAQHRGHGSFPHPAVRSQSRHQSEDAETMSLDDTVHSNRSASRLLAWSRAGFMRWLRRQRRLMSAKRSLRGLRAWSKSTAGVDAVHPEAPLPAQYATPTSLPPFTISKLHRCAAQAAPSPWELALPPLWTDENATDNALGDVAVSHGTTASAKRITRAQLLEQLKAAIAAGTAASHAQKRRLVETEAVSAVRPPACEAPELSLDDQRIREHADDLARLTESLTMLTQFDRVISADAGRGTHVHGANSPEDAQQAPRANVEQEPNSAAVPSLVSTSEKAMDCALPAQPSSHAHAFSIIAAGGHGRSFHSDAPDPLHRGPRGPGGRRRSVPTTEDSSALGAFRSLLTDTTHTLHDAEVRAVYEVIMNEVCTPLVQRDVEGAIDVSSSATDRALTQWVERQLVMEMTQSCAEFKQTRADERDSATPSASARQPRVYTGVTQHIRSGTPVSLDHLRLDDLDRQILESVDARGASDAIAVKFDTAGYTISYRQLASLRSRSWLNDQVINNYLQLLCVEAEESAAAPLSISQRRHRIASLGTHFFTKVESDFGTKSISYNASQLQLPPLSSSSAILRWLRHRKHLLQPYIPSDPRSVRVVLVPVNIEAQHWALAVLYCADNRWVMYDSMSRSDLARQRGAMILAQLSHAWRECQRHFGLLNPDSTAAGAAASQTIMTAQHSQTAAAPQPSLWVSARVVASPYVPFTDTVKGGGHAVVSPLDSLQPYNSLDELHRAAKRLRHHEELFVEQASQRTPQVVSGTRRDGGGAGSMCSAGTALMAPQMTQATTLPVGQLSDAEVEWFTGGFDRIPQQANGNDCGVFVCQVAWCIAQGVAVSFGQSDITRLRTVILLELFNKKLLRRYPTANTSSSAGV